MPKEEKIFTGLDALIQTRISSTVLLRGKQLPSEFIEKHLVHVKLKKDEKCLGLSIRQGVITRVLFDSPLKGLILVGDVILIVNGNIVTFDDKMKEREKPLIEEAKRQCEDFASQMHQGKKSMDIGIIRLRSRLPATTLPPKIQVSEGHEAEYAILYQYRFLKLGLNIQQIQESVLVNYTAPDSSSSLCLSIGETILSIEDAPVTDLNAVKERLIDNCYKKSYVKLLVEYPTTDILKNMTRNRLGQAAKEYDRPNFAISSDVRKYAEIGIETLKTCSEPESILAEPKTPKKEQQTKTVTKQTVAKTPSKSNKRPLPWTLVKKELSFFKKEQSPSGALSFRETADETDIPSEWNSKLFVVLPPLKTVESEKGGGTPNNTSVYKKT